MDIYQQYEIRKTESQNDEYTFILYLDDNYMEFADELGSNLKERKDILSTAKEIIKNRYPNLKVTMIKVMIGGMAITSIPLLGDNAQTVHAAERAAITAQISQSSSIYYQVTSGDTLWNISRQYNTTVDNIKKANHLTSDSLQLNQRLIIPKAFHMVESGDYLSVLAKRYGTTVDAIKEANRLSNDVVRLGQTLIIPVVMGEQSSEATTRDVSTSIYTVVAGDTLWAIANRNNVTVDALRNVNRLTSDLLKIGQTLTIPLNSSIDNALPSSSAPITKNNQYTVVPGDTLSAISRNYNVSVEQIKQANQLTSDTIRVGLVLIIPNAVEVTPVEPTPNIKSSDHLESIQKDLQALGYYAVPTMTGNYDTPTTQAIKSFQGDYSLPITGKVDEVTGTSIEHAIVKKELINDTVKYQGVPYKWSGTTPSGFDCSGFVYYMFNQHGVDMPRNTSAGLFQTGKAIDRAHLQPGDLVFFSINASGSITHVGFYMGNNQFISATSSQGIAQVSMDNSYWSKYYVGAKRIY